MRNVARPLPASDPAPRSVVGLSLGHSCRRLLIWECHIAHASLAGLLANRLEERGYTPSARSVLLSELTHPDEHSVVIVPRTGRVQIRVHYLTPLCERRAKAAEVAMDISACLAGEPDAGRS